MSRPPAAPAEPKPAPRVRLATPDAAGERLDGVLWIEVDGAFLGKTSERLRVTMKGELLEERPLLGLEHVFVVGAGVSLSAEAIRVCSERGIPLSFVSRSGQPYAKLIAPELTGTVQTRRQQLLAYLDQRGLQLAIAFTTGKLLNQAALLKYMAKYRRESDPNAHEQAREAAFQIEMLVQRVQRTEGSDLDLVRQPLMNLEAQAARRYWDACRTLVSHDGSWTKRETRGAPDLVNQCLNYGYGILYAHVERAILLAGLDPYAGFMHEDRPGKPSLVLDLIEEFRQMVVDRCIFAALNQRVPLAQDEDGRLTPASRSTIAQRIGERLEADEPYEGRKLRLRSILQSQARHLATYLRGEGKLYKAWVGRW